MLPWEHAAVGYLAYSLLVHACYRRSPDGVETVAVVIGSQFPDLVDKPLAWQFGVVESGYAVGHSVFVAVPVAVAAGALARARGRAGAALAFAVGYLAHLPGDVVPDYLREGRLPTEVVLWPVRTGPPNPRQPVVPHALAIFEEYARTLASPDPPTYLLVQFGFVALTALLWLYDGAPVARELALGMRRLLAGAVRRAE